MDEPTDFAPGGRAPLAELERQEAATRGLELLQDVLATVPDLVMILNERRQVVFANRSVLEQVGGDEAAVRGLRPGEILGCLAAEGGPDGCGTSRTCRSCGLVAAILEAAHGDDADSVARIPLSGGEILELGVRTHPVEVDGERLIVLTLSDRRDRERRQALERLLFRDVLPRAGGVQGLSWLLRCADEESREQLVDTLEAHTRTLMRDIRRLHLLTAVEEGGYQPRVKQARVGAVIREVTDAVDPDDDSYVYLVLDSPLPHDTVETDPWILGVVLDELVRNAVEASRPGMEVRVGADVEGGRITFRVHNRASMPPTVARQVFQRSFSTRGPGRGLGAHVARRFTHDVLGGRISFTSSDEAGTTFRVELPLEWPFEADGGEEAPEDRTSGDAPPARPSANGVRPPSRPGRLEAS